MSLNRNKIIQALDYLHPGGYEGLDATKPTPSTYAEYLDAETAETPHSERALTDAAFEQGKIEEKVKERAIKRSALFTQWESLPAWIKGPYRATFAAAVELLDDGQDEEAVALIQYEDAKAGYTTEQKETFEMVRAEIVTAMENLG